MGYFAPAFLAFCLNSCGVYIFREVAKPGCEPLISCLIFLFSVFLLLWDIRLFPSSLRKIWRGGSYFFHFITSAFIMEHIMTDFWFPMELSLTSLLPRIAQFEEDILRQNGWAASGISQSLRMELAHVISSYLMSFFFLFSVMHATRIVDFRLLRCGLKEFFSDISSRFGSTCRRLKRMVWRSRNVKFQLSESRITPCRNYSPRASPSKDYLNEDSADELYCSRGYKHNQY